MNNLENSTAIVKFMGLGIICFNQKEKRCETLFIHDPKHKPAIKVYLQEDLGTMNATFVDGKNIEPKLAYFYLPTSGLTDENETHTLTIEITGVGNSEIDGYTKYQAKKFDRLSLKSDVNDYRWVANLERDNLLGDGEKKRIRNKKVAETSKLYIGNAEFFTYDLVIPDPNTSTETSPQLFFQRKFVASQTKKGLQENIEYAEYGYTANYVGARINADFVKLKMTVGKEEHIHLLPKRKTPYLIQVDNALSDGGDISDMPVYQGFWKTKDKKQFDLLIESELRKEHTDRGLQFKYSKSGDGAGTRKTCYLVESNANGIREFMED